jgi:hypothetical protein
MPEGGRRCGWRRSWLHRDSWDLTHVLPRSPAVISRASADFAILRHVLDDQPLVARRSPRLQDEAADDPGRNDPFRDRRPVRRSHRTAPFRSAQLMTIVPYHRAGGGEQGLPLPLLCTRGCIVPQSEPDLNPHTADLRKPTVPDCAWVLSYSVSAGQVMITMCPRGDLNTRSREISPIEEIMRSA